MPNNKTVDPIRILLNVLIMMVFMNACIFAKDITPITYPFSEMRRIAVLPVVNGSGEEKIKYSPKKVRKYAMKMLKNLRYEPFESNDEAVLKGLMAEDLKNADKALIDRVVPPNERWALIVCVGDVSSKLGLGSSANAQIYSFLVDKERSKIAWWDEASAYYSSGGLIGMLEKGAVKNAAIQWALYLSLEAFPKLTKKGKTVSAEGKQQIFTNLAIRPFDTQIQKEFPPDFTEKLARSLAIQLGKANRFREISFIKKADLLPANVDIELIGTITKFNSGRKIATGKIEAMVEFKEVATGKILYTTIVDGKTGIFAQSEYESTRSLAKDLAKSIKANMP
jgi:hypothetical protein